MLLKYPNIVYAHCFIVYTGKPKLMINMSDVTAQMLGTEVWKIEDEARKKPNVVLKHLYYDIISAVHLCNRNCCTSPSVQ